MGRRVVASVLAMWHHRYAIRFRNRRATAFRQKNGCGERLSVTEFYRRKSVSGTPSERAAVTPLRVRVSKETSAYSTRMANASDAVLYPPTDDNPSGPPQMWRALPSTKGWRTSTVWVTVAVPSSVWRAPASVAGWSGASSEACGRFRRSFDDHLGPFPQ